MKKARIQSANTIYWVYGLMLFLFMAWWAMSKRALVKIPPQHTSLISSAPTADAPPYVHHVSFLDDSCKALFPAASPSSNGWELRNSWSDQNRGAKLVEEAGSLRLIQRSDGQNYIWLLQQHLTYPIVKNKAYVVSFDLLEVNPNEIDYIEVGLASGLEWSSPLLIQAPSRISFSDTAHLFSGLKAEIKASKTITVGLAFKIKWKHAPKKETVLLVKGIQICEKQNTTIPALLSNNRR